MNKKSVLENILTMAEDGAVANGYVGEYLQAKTEIIEFVSILQKNYDSLFENNNEISAAERIIITNIIK